MELESSKALENEPPTVEHWFAAKKTPAHIVASARVLNGWAIGRALTEKQFDEGIQKTLAVASK